MQQGIPPKKLSHKLLEVMKKITHVPKRGWNDFHKYHYVLEADITDAIRQLLCDVGINISVSIAKAEDVDPAQGIVRAYVDIELEDVDSGERRKFQGIGDGQDLSKTGKRGDKAVYKAITGACKYAFQKHFMMPTGDDPEKDGDSHDSQNHVAPTAATAAPHSRPPSNQKRAGMSVEEAGAFVMPFGPKTRGTPLKGLPMGEVESALGWAESKGKFTEFQEAARIWVSSGGPLGEELPF